MKSQTHSRRAIMDRLRTRAVDSAELPSVDESQLTQYQDPVDRFCEMVSVVGGQTHRVDQPGDAKNILNEWEEFRLAQHVASLVPDAVEGNIDLSQVDDPHDLKTLDWVIARGEFGVAENGAIWVDGDTLIHRVVLFIPQYLALMVSRSQIVHHMHQAYERIGRPRAPFGVFVSGPSKTADIEQSLVLGAHGCRALQVILTP